MLLAATIFYIIDDDLLNKAALKIVWNHATRESKIIPQQTVRTLQTPRQTKIDG